MINAARAGEFDEAWEKKNMPIGSGKSTVCEVTQMIFHKGYIYQWNVYSQFDTLMEPLTFYFKQENVLPKIGAIACSEEDVEQMKAESMK